MDSDTLNLLITHLTRLFFILVGAISVANALRYRTRTRVDIALLFGMLGLVVLEQVFRAYIPDNLWLRLLPSMLLMSLGHLTLRLVQHFRRVPRWLRIASLTGLIASIVLLVLFPTSERPSVVTLVLVVYLVALEVYAVFAFVRGAATTSGVTHWRLMLVAAATGFMALVFVISGLNTALPAVAPYTSPLSSLAGLLSGIAYYAGFAPPRWLRRYWQLNELQQFLQEGATAAGDTTTSEHLTRLVRFAVRLVGGVQSVAGLWDADRQKLEFSEETSAHASFDTPFLAAVMHEAMVDNTVRLIDLRQSRRQPRRQSRGDNPQNDQPLETEVAYVVPVIKHQPLGILTVFLRYTSLFPDDDLEILRLLAESSATDLDYVRLLERRRALLDKLNTRTEQLEEANRELEAFAYTVSHDLRAPLRAVDGFSRIIYEDYRHLLPPDGQETLDLIIENSKQMGQLIDDLLRLSRLGRAEVIRTTIDMQELAKEVVGEQIRTAPHRSIEVKLDALPPAEANRSLMKQVLANLVSNAVKFTRACEHARIEIGSHQENGHPVYFVRDNGVGFDMQYANKLFGVFQRLQNPEDYEGTGVGLAIVQRIIRKHGGRVWAEAAPNQGAAFYFELGEAESE